MKRLISLFLAIVCVFGIASASLVTANAANETVAELKNITVKNVKTGQYLNYDYGTLKNGTTLRVWPWDGSKEQHFDIKKVKEGTYRILTNASSKYCVDVYRGNAKLKAGQSCDIWKAGDDATAQNVVFHKCDDGSYIIRMAANTGLALAAGSSKAQLKLVKFSATDKSQKWIFQDKNGKNIDISSGAVEYKPAVEYKKTGNSYTIDGAKYYEAITTKAHYDIAKGYVFWLDAKNNIVTDGTVNSKIARLDAANAQLQMLKSATEGYVFASETFYEVFKNIKATEKLGEMIGKTSGALLSIGIGNGAVSVGDAAVKLAKSSITLEDVKAVAFSSLVKIYCSNAAATGKAAIPLLSKPITDYATLEKAYTLYAETCASHSAVKHLIGEDVEEMARSNTFKELLKYFKNVVTGLADFAFENIDNIKEFVEGVKKVEQSKLLIEGLQMTISMQEAAESAGVLVEYEKRYNEIISFIKVEQKDGVTETTKKLSTPYNKNVAYELYDEVEALMGKYQNGTKKADRYFSASNAYECHGFACEALMDFWGTAKPTPSNKDYQYFKASAKESYVSKIRPGDMVRYRIEGTVYDHTIVITNVDNDYVYYADCNADGKCTFKYNMKMSKSDLAKKLKLVLNDQAVSTRGYVCHYKKNAL